jgi:hypothetical protein
MSKYSTQSSYGYDGPTDVNPAWFLQNLPTVNVQRSSSLDPTSPVPANPPNPVQVINFVGGGITLTLKTANLIAGFTLYLINTSGSGAAAVVLDNGGLIGSATTLSIRTNSVRIIQSTGSGTGSAFNILQ